MAKQLTYRKWNQLLIASWPLAFKKTFMAIRVNRELNSKVAQSNALAFNPDYLRRKIQIIDRVVKRYQVDSAEWSDEFWLKTSRIAASKNIKVKFSPSLAGAEADSASVISRQDIEFEGDFRSLVLLLDSVQKTDKVGFITSAAFRKEEVRMQAEKDKLSLKLVFSILEKD
jgi:hypothetical protein